MTRSLRPRRGVIAGALAALALLAGPVLAAPTPPAEDGMALGNPKAPVTVVEYASLGCPHCAAWAEEVFPKFKAKYVTTGKVRYVLREMLYGNTALATAGFMTARCAGPAKYFDVVDAVYRAQTEVQRQGNAYVVLLGVAKNAGLSQAQFDACLADQKGIAAINAHHDQAEADGVRETPTFFVNGKRLTGEVTLETLSAAIAAAGKL